ncbi:S9 family peptidase [Rhizosaccharibacter radicis]|uniref:Prolyl oligopeptidase family serine peptidase n=1 Tax=Rhizosaccharibacter radicis TaxID=2782605 RepID=A0ABT1W275_9PROT|nr:prolyl oligopeptidase family serine peptidase [Acetobacteraceae bacterium KSS12]
MRFSRRSLLLAAIAQAAAMARPRGGWAAGGTSPAQVADPAMAEAVAAAALPPAPAVARHPVRKQRFGIVRFDEYDWLRQPDWFTALLHPERLSPAIRAQLDAENRYADAVLAPTDALQAEMLAEMRRRSAGAGSTPPEPDGRWIWWSELRPGAQQPVFLRRPREGGPAQLLFDFDADARGKRYYRLSSLKGPAHSPDGRYLAWTVDLRGDEHFTLFVRDLEQGRFAQAPIEDCYGEFVFSPDSRFLFWLERDGHSRPARLFRRPVGGGADVLVHHETDPAMFVTLRRSASNRFVMIEIGNETQSEVRLIPADRIEDAPVVAEPRTPGLRYALEHWNDRFVVRTNADGAVDNKLMQTPEAFPARAHWRPWIPYRPGRLIAEMRAFRDHFARVEWIDANPVLIAVGADGTTERRVAGEDAAYVLSLDQDAEYGSALVRFTVQSMRRPPRAETVDMNSGARAVVWQQEAPDVRPDDYVVERLDAPGTDGVRVPVSLLRRRTTPVDGSAPLMLYGYGSYGYSLPPEFVAADLSLADRGWVVAIAHARGGAERGTAWFTQTLTVHKGRTVSDFVDAASFLARERYTRAGAIVGHSFSAGGILIGGAINRRPDLFAGAIGQVPFVDVLDTMEDETNPLVDSAKPLWGDPADPAMFRAMAAFAPYENVRRQPYPAVLATAGLLDDRVGYWEAAKWVARLRERSTSGRPVMLRVNMHAGHQGDAGRDDELRQRASFYGFAIRAVSGAWDAKGGTARAPEN